MSPILGQDEASYYQTLIDVMRWMIEIRCIDINTKVSLLSLYLAMLRQGHLEEVPHIMSYLKLRHNSRLAYDPSYPNMVHSNFWEFDWVDFYNDASGTYLTQCSTVKAERGGSRYIHRQQSCWLQADKEI